MSKGNMYHIAKYPGWCGLVKELCRATSQLEEREKDGWGTYACSIYLGCYGI